MRPANSTKAMSGLHRWRSVKPLTGSREHHHQHREHHDAQQRYQQPVEYRRKPGVRELRGDDNVGRGIQAVKIQL